MFCVLITLYSCLHTQRGCVTLKLHITVCASSSNASTEAGFGEPEVNLQYVDDTSNGEEEERKEDEIRMMLRCGKTVVFCQVSSVTYSEAQPVTYHAIKEERLRGTSILFV